MSDLNYGKLLLITVIETFSPPKTPEEERRFEELIKKPKYRRLREFRQTWMNHLTMIGRLEAKRSTLLQQISAKFGAPSDELVWKIRRQRSLEELDALLENVLTASSVAELGPLGSTNSTA